MVSSGFFLVLQGCFKGRDVSKKLDECFKDISREFKSDFKAIIKLFQGYFKEVSILFQRCFQVLFFKNV